MNEKRDTIVYKLVDGDPNCFESTVYVGIGAANDTYGEEKEHRIKEKKFVKLVVISKRLTRHQAYHFETQELKEYYDRFGDLPIYNRDGYTYQRIEIA